MPKTQIIVVTLLVAMLLIIGACAPAPITPVGETPTPSKTAPPTKTTPAGKIAFVTAGNIHIINSDGTNEARLTEGTNPIWSPDGKKIAYNQNDGLYVINADGTSKIKAVSLKKGESTNSIENHNWSPDANRILFGRHFSPDENDNGIWTINSDGSNPVRLVAESKLGGAVFSPDGRKIAYYGSALYVMDSDGTNKTKISEKNYPDSSINSLRWSPDGTKIAYGEGYMYIYVINSDGGNKIKLTFQRFVSSPRWSPDGSRIAYEGDDGGPSYIYIANPDGTGKKEVALGGLGGSFDWSPSGAKFVFSADETVYIINTDSTGLKKLALGSYVLWSPK